MQKRLAIGRGVKNLDLKNRGGTPPASLRVKNTISQTILKNANYYNMMLHTMILKIYSKVYM